MKPAQVQNILINKGIHIFTPEMFGQIFPAPSYTIKYWLESQTKQGLLKRLKRGLYTLSLFPPLEEEVANRLYRPSYISLEYALAYYNLLQETPYTITSVTTKPTRTFMSDNKTFSYRTIKRKAYTGYFLEKKSGASFLIAEPEKALADYLYFVTLHKSPYNERLIEHLTDPSFYRTKRINREKLFHYTRLFEHKGLHVFMKEL